MHLRTGKTVAATALLALLMAACAGDDTGGRERAGTGADTSADLAPWPDSAAELLLEMGRRDQAVREGMNQARLRDSAFMAELSRTDSVLSRRLMELVERHGWPTGGAVGDSAVAAAFLVVQHSPFTEWQRSMLPEVERSVRTGTLSGQEFALLFDRVRGRLGLPQRFGTQLGLTGDTLVLHELENPDSVDAWRAAVGLPPLEEYLDMVEEAYGAPVRRD